MTFRYITIFDYKDFDLTVFSDKSKANENISKASELAEKLGIYINVPHMFLSKPAQKNKICRCPWNYTYIENQGTVNACVFAGKHIGNLNKSNFEDIWNSDQYQRIRKELIEENPNNICKKCIEYDCRNVDKITSHITFRSSTNKKMTQYIIKNKKKYGLSDRDIF